MSHGLNFIEHHARHNAPFLSMIWFHAPHVPCVASPKYLKKYERADRKKQHYYGVISAMDEQVGRLHSALRDLEIDKNTIIWFLSDNGPEINKPNQYLGSTGGLRGRKRSLFNGGIQVPSFVYWYDHLMPNDNLTVPISSFDIYPTMINIVQRAMYGTDLKFQSKLPFDGIDVWGILDGTVLERTTPIPLSYHYTGSLTHGLIQYPYKLLINLKQKGFTIHTLLFNIVTDSGETQNIADKNPLIVASMTLTLQDWIMKAGRSYMGYDYINSDISRNKIAIYHRYFRVNSKRNTSGSVRPPSKFLNINVETNVEMGSHQNLNLFTPDWPWSVIDKCGDIPISHCLSRQRSRLNL
jgi:arylsulfatase A-like enzyme